MLARCLPTCGGKEGRRRGSAPKQGRKDGARRGQQGSELTPLCGSGNVRRLLVTRKELPPNIIQVEPKGGRRKESLNNNVKLTVFTVLKYCTNGTR